MAFRTGHIPDSPEVVKRRLGLHLHPSFGAMKAIALPLKTTNRAKLPTSQGGPGILNQNDTGSCEGHAHASGGTLFFACAGTPLPEVISPVGLYYGALLVDQQPNSDGSLPPLLDSGTMPSSIVNAWQLWGATGASQWGQYPASSATMYVNPSDPNSPLIAPKVEQLFAEFPVKFGGAFFVQTLGQQKIVDIMSALATGYPVSDAIAASGSAFQGYSGGVLTAAQMTGDIDHANLITDYEWTGTQEQLTAWLGGAAGLDQYLMFHGVNSWSETWGEVDSINNLGGQYRFDRTFADALESPCVLDLKRAA